jgi:hypothetical protein
MNLTTEEPYDDKSTGPMKYNKLFAIEERLRAYEGNDLFNPIRGAKICLVPNIMVPKDFRVSDFIKYTRLEFLNTHLQSYYNKMTEVIYNDKMLIYFFEDNLKGSTLNWYVRLENTRIKKWKDLAEAFLKQYKFNQ